jgi:hypothetical protein
MKRKARMWWELGALGAVVGAVLVVGSRPMTITVPKIDTIGPSAHDIDSIASAVAVCVIAIIVLGILILIAWLVRNIIRRGTRPA